MFNEFMKSFVVCINKYEAQDQEDPDDCEQFTVEQLTAKGADFYDCTPEFLSELLYGGVPLEEYRDGYEYEKVQEDADLDGKQTVYKITKDENSIYVAFNGYYCSYQSNFHMTNITEVKPKEVTLTQYEDV